MKQNSVKIKLIGPTNDYSSRAKNHCKTQDIEANVDDIMHDG